MSVRSIMQRKLLHNCITCSQRQGAELIILHLTHNTEAPLQTSGALFLLKLAAHGISKERFHLISYAALQSGRLNSSDTRTERCSDQLCGFPARAARGGLLLLSSCGSQDSVDAVC